ncbi:uncharacterized protein V2V93DRAFT_366462 [Kockiozyma suomiensis]|uniref:uncharacterized protein n=1 Tax=Kockiozyma suomiensis TaxID=1337062 RepID=UPI0033440301
MAAGDATEDTSSSDAKNKGKGSNSSAAASMGASASALFRSFATPAAASASLSSAGAQKGQSSGFNSEQHLESSSVVPNSQRSAVAGSSAASARSSFRAASDYRDSTSSREAQSQYDSFTANHSNYSSNGRSIYSTPSYSGENDGDAVLAFLSSSHTTEEIYSPMPDIARRAPAPTPSQVGYDQILADTVAVQDPVEYLLSTNKYTSDVWGDEWPELQLAIAEQEKGDTDKARRRVEDILGRIKAKL